MKARIKGTSRWVTIRRVVYSAGGSTVCAPLSNFDAFDVDVAESAAAVTSDTASDYLKCNNNNKTTNKDNGTSSTGR
jgi:hypothetical protein